MTEAKLFLGVIGAAMDEEKLKEAIRKNSHNPDLIVGEEVSLKYTCSLTPNEYQKRALTTRMPLPNEIDKVGIIYATMLLAGEAGEFSNKVSKILRDKDWIFSNEDIDTLALELGDVLWSLADLSSSLGITLEEVMQKNLDKLESRQKRGKLKGSGDDR